MVLTEIPLRVLLVVLVAEAQQTEVVLLRLVELEHQDKVTLVVLPMTFQLEWKGLLVVVVAQELLEPMELLAEVVMEELEHHLQ